MDESSQQTDALEQILFDSSLSVAANIDATIRRLRYEAAEIAESYFMAVVADSLSCSKDRAVRAWMLKQQLCSALEEVREFMASAR